MPGDPYWDSVVFLSGFEGGSVVDESPLAQTVTTVGAGIALSAAQAKFGTQSLNRSTNTRSYISVPDHANFISGTTPFTIEGWFRWPTVPLSGYCPLLAHWDYEADIGSWNFFHYGSGGGYLGLSVSTNGDDVEEWEIYGGVFAPVADTWYYIAVDYDGTDYRFYVDGVMLNKEAGTWSLSDITAPLVIGTIPTAGGLFSGNFVGFYDELRVTAGIARYASDSGFSAPVAAFERGPDFDVTIAESLAFEGLIGSGAIYLDTLAEGLGVTQVLVPGFPVVATDTLGLSPRCFVVYRQLVTLTETLGLEPLASTLRGVVLVEALRLSATIAPNQIGSITVAETLGLIERLIPGIPVAVAETLALSITESIQHAITVIEGLSLSEVLLPAALYNFTVAEDLGLTSSLANFFGADVVEGLELAPSATANMLLNQTLTEGLGLADSHVANLVLRVTIEEGLGLEDVELLNSIYHGEITEALGLHLAYISPGGGFTAWAMNTRTAAVTEYDSYEFNSFARLGDTYIGATSAGLYELVGDDDAGDNIVARIKSGFAQWAGARFTILKGVYLGMRVESGSFVLKVITGEGRTYVYSVQPRNMRTTKVTIGKGVKTRYLRFELISTGQDFDLESVEFIPLVAERRI
jgi:hypothetical protein